MLAGRAHHFSQRLFSLISQDDNGRAVLRGFDKGNGDVLAEIDLPAKPWGAPMSYYEEGKQFIVIASGEGKNARLIALSI